MNTEASAIQNLTQEAFTALQTGNSRQARDVFDRIIATGQTDATTWLGMAHACSQLGDKQATLAAVDKSLEADSGNLRALLFKAEHLEQYGEVQAGTGILSACPGAGEKRGGITRGC